MRTIWIGLIGVKRRNNSPLLKGCKGAYANVLAEAESNEEFISIVSNQAEELLFAVNENVWYEPLEKRLEKHNVDNYLLEFAREINEQGGCRFGIFHAREVDDVEI